MKDAITDSDKYTAMVFKFNPLIAGQKSEQVQIREKLEKLIEI